MLIINKNSEINRELSYSLLFVLSPCGDSQWNGQQPTHVAYMCPQEKKIWHIQLEVYHTGLLKDSKNDLTSVNFLPFSLSICYPLIIHYYNNYIFSLGTPTHLWGCRLAQPNLCNAVKKVLWLFQTLYSCVCLVFPKCAILLQPRADFDYGLPSTTFCKRTLTNEVLT